MPHILIIEDCMDMLEVLEEAFGLFDFRVSTGTSGYEGLNYLMTQQIDLIITDWYMPDMSGFALVQYIRQTPEWRHIPIIVMSSNSDNMRPALHSGANYYVQKPFDFGKLIKTVEKFLGAGV